MKRLKTAGIIVSVMILLVGCSTKDEPVNVDANHLENETITETAIEKLPIEEEVIEEVIETATSKINGAQIPKENVALRPFAVMLDNHTGARPQAGLDQADLVYEIPVEGGITRYMAIFQSETPKLIGPVRSARPYFIDKALEFKSLYVHDGGSPQAFADIANLKVADISAQSRGSDVFWRKNHKKAPHNEYTSGDAVRKAAKHSGFLKEVEFDQWTFKEKDGNIEGDAVAKFEIPFDKGYQSRFTYNDEDQMYYREINGKPHVDETSNMQINVKNILIQKVKTKVLDSAGRLKVDTVSSGKGYYITNGSKVNVKWEKTSRTGLTKFYNADGTVLSMNPGKIWVVLIPNDMEINILNEG